MIIDEDEHLIHYGILRRSGRYPWNSGGNQSQSARNRAFLDYVDDLKKQGLKNVDICKGLGLGKSDDEQVSTTQLIAARVVAKNQQKQAQISRAQRLRDKGTGATAIGRIMGLPESSVRALLEPGAKDKADVLTSIASMLKREIDKTGPEGAFLDVGTGVENYIPIDGTKNHIGISKDRLNTAVFMLKEEGYVTHSVNVPQLGTGHDTKVKVLCPPGTTWGEAQRNKNKIRQIREFSSDGGRTFDKIHDPISINPNRVSVRYKSEGGDKADGVIYVRPGVEDVNLGKSLYAQVRIQVGEDRYLKGMAMYKDDLPPGIDLIFNTDKESTGNKLDAMKPISDDPQLPFGSIVRQIVADRNTDNERLTSAMNIVNEAGDWAGWAKTLSSQFLSKQSPVLAKAQLKKTQERSKKDLEEILNLTNPTVKKKLLEKFAEGADSDAVHLKAAALPKSNWHAILPIDSMPEGQVYAPGYDNGERVALIRYPHGGTFEIPDLIVNNKQPEAKKLLSDAPDAIGIHSSVAVRLSGADFDGDTVLVIPNNIGNIKISPALDGLRNFDPKSSYKAYDGMVRISKARKEHEMGKISNLITDMTIRGASHEELARAVRHSMVVIDSENHNLNFKQSALDHGIKQLVSDYQDTPRGGASTLLSRKKSPIYLNELRPARESEGGPVDKVTGRRNRVESGRTRRNSKGELEPKKGKYKKLDLADDAHDLSSGTRMEKIYADHSNTLKGLANRARLAALSTPNLVRSQSAKKNYPNEVASLESKLLLAKMNRPRERQAQIIAGAMVRSRRDANPNMDSETRKKIEYQELDKARDRVGAERHEIRFTMPEWDAIQAGAISNHMLDQILDRADIDQVRELATPRRQPLMSTANIQRAQALFEGGATRAEVAAALGVSLTTLDTVTAGESEA